MNNHEDYMNQAINLAKKGLGSVSNPLVGCVIVKRGRVIGEGFHEVLSIMQKYLFKIVLNLLRCFFYMLI